MSDHQISLFPLNNTSCYCTGQCQKPGGICPQMHTVTVQQGWKCAGCGNQWSPWIVQCPLCAPKYTQPTPDCGCPPNSVCNNTICPRAIRITCS